MKTLSARGWRVLAGVAFFLFAFFFPMVVKLFVATAAVAPVLNVAILAATAAIAALGLNIIVGYCGLLNLGFAGFMLIGAYTAGILMKEYGWSFWMAAPVAAAHGALWGIILGIPTLRLVGDYFAIVTFGFSELVIMVAKNWVNVTRGPAGYPDVPRPVLDFSWVASVFGAAPEKFRLVFTGVDRVPYWYLAAFLLGVCMLISDRLSRSRVGRAWLAIREDEVAAEACGIDARWYKTMAFATSAAIGALAGAFQASYLTLVDYRNYEFMTSVYVLCYVVLGGMGTVLGPVIGATILVSLVELLRTSPLKYLADLMVWWPPVQKWLASVPWVPDMRLIIYGIILILMIRFRPEGIVSSRVRARELHTHFEPGEEDGLSLYVLHSR
ncbi:MAG: branched-chain amino acid ABC transporter permease [Candidatus Sumerlaeaceae bacterium]|nr:branched-chain amino acid ABC transporter permease [Candidatus Sumerlaeaceae bacterium]